MQYLLCVLKQEMLANFQKMFSGGWGLLVEGWGIRDACSTLVPRGPESKGSGGGELTGGRANTTDFLCILKQETLAFFENWFLGSRKHLASAGGGGAEGGGVSGNNATSEHVLCVLKQETLANFQKWFSGGLGVLWRSPPGGLLHTSPKPP